ncbi:hypothetical protein [uncultured Cetobacterium sp.]|uniref:hypothetical protein n=1 Tax=uncultured Cetobacterium sp. TaxID=527638 RepID=UPI0026025747|nr:hypothetical protein [uncultured Cetobacterium sp.]
MGFFNKLFNKNKKIEEIKTEKTCEKVENCGCKTCENETSENYVKKMCISIETIPCEQNPYFKAEKESTKFFVEYEIRMTTIERFFKINDIFLKEYQRVAKESLHSTRTDKDEFSKYSKCYFINNNAFKDIHYMSTLLNVFMIFETLLKNIVKDIAYDQNSTLEDIHNKNTSYLNGYIYFLEDTFKKNLEIEDKEKDFIGIVKKIRNDYLHGYMTEIPESMEREIVKIFNLRLGKRIEVNENFIDNTCEIFGEIAKKCEIAYWKYKNRHLRG